MSNKNQFEKVSKKDSIRKKILSIRREESPISLIESASFFHSLSKAFILNNSDRLDVAGPLQRVSDICFIHGLSKRSDGGLDSKDSFTCTLMAISDHYIFFVAGRLESHGILSPSFDILTDTSVDPYDIMEAVSLEFVCDAIHSHSWIGKGEHFHDGHAIRLFVKTISEILNCGGI